MSVKRVIYWVAVFVVVFVTFWFGFVHKSGRKEAPEKVIPVEVETVGTGSIQETIELTGWIKANTVVDIKSKVPGRIESLQAVGVADQATMSVEEGLVVKKGQQLAVIDHNVYLAQVAAAEAELKAKEVELADAEREKKRIVALYEGGSATQQSRDKAVTAAKLAAAREAFARANLELAQINLTESVIVSPIDGVVTAKHIDEGNLVSAGSRIVTVADIRTVKIIAAIAEKYLMRKYIRYIRLLMHKRVLYKLKYVWRMMEHF
jgi:membrane fusion protein (multidrug efflux system)